MKKIEKVWSYFRSRSWAFWAGFLILGVYSVFRVVNTLPVLQEMRVDWDTHQYVEISKIPVWERGFWAGIKPFSTPLVFKLVGQDRSAVGLFFLLFSTLSWGFFAVQVGRTMKHSLVQVGGLSFILVFSLNRQITGWDGILISESLSFTLLVLFLGAWLALIRGWKWWKMALLLLIAFFWVFARDTNAYLALMLGLLIAVFSLVSRPHRRYLWIAGGLVVFFGLSSSTANLGQRWVLPFQHVLTRRIWYSKEDTGFFKACGMPASPEIYDMAGGLSVDEDWALYDEFQTWTLTSGKRCYYRWLFSDLGRSFQEPLADLEFMLGYHKKLYAPAYEQILPQRVEDLVYPYQSGLILVYLAWLGAGVVLRKKFLREDPRRIVPVMMVLLFIPHAILVWHADAVDIDRHALQAGIQFFLGFWLFCLFTVDLGLMKLAQWWQLSKTSDMGN